jgi:hypothetical protein
MVRVLLVDFNDDYIVKIGINSFGEGRLWAAIHDYDKKYFAASLKWGHYIIRNLGKYQYNIQRRIKFSDAPPTEEHISLVLNLSIKYKIADIKPNRNWGLDRYKVPVIYDYAASSYLN